MSPHAVPEVRPASPVPPVPTVAVDLAPVDQLTLALIRMTAWQGEAIDRPGGEAQIRSWKGYSFATLRKLADAGLIVDKAGQKTLQLTLEGRTAAEEFLHELGTTASEIPVRPYTPSASRASYSRPVSL